MQKTFSKINALIASLINCTENLFSESTAQNSRRDKVEGEASS